MNKYFFGDFTAEISGKNLENKAKNCHEQFHKISMVQAHNR